MEITENLIHKAEQKLIFGHNISFTKAQVKNIRFACEKQIIQKWVECPYDNKIKCPNCMTEFNTIDNCTETFNYCPNCGQMLHS